jgi:hypothetical protein
MPTSAGPNSKGENSLVFAIDMADTRNSYIGEPTVNIRASSGLDGSYSASGRVIDNSGTLKAPDGSTGWSSISSPGSNADYRIAKFSYNTLTEGSTYTFSLELYNPGPNALEIFVDGNHGQPGTTIPLGYSRYSYTYTITRAGGGTWAIFFGAENKQANVVYSPSRLIYFKNYQVEEKFHVTPFVEDQRSSTEALLDLTKNNTIDLSDALTSYDSEASIVFDGTNDQIVQPYDMVGMTDYTITVWAKSNIDRTTLTETYYSALGGYHSGGSYLRYDIRQADSAIPGYILFWAGGPQTFTSYNFPEDFDINSWHEYTYTHSTSFQRMYVDGVLVKEALFNNSEPLSISYTRIGRYAGSYWSGEIDVFRVYNKALTSEEISANYNILEKRFNI